MRFEYRFCLPYHTELIKMLEERKIRYTASGPFGEFFSDGRPVPVFVTFRIKDYSTFVDELSEKYRYKPQVSMSYSSSEINTAQILWMTPQKQCINILNTEEAFSYSCTWVDARGMQRSHHREQIGLLSIEKEPSTKSQTAFWAPSTGFSEIFTDLRVKDLAASNELRGIDFLPTKVGNGSHSGTIFQLATKNVVHTDHLILGKGEQEIFCPMCGRKQFAFSNTYQLFLDRNAIAQGEDIYVTKRIFGQGIARPLYLISHRFYQLLKEHRLTANTYFEPVVIV